MRRTPLSPSVPRFAFLLALWAALLALVPGSALAAPPLDPKEIPEPLKPWTAWALAGATDAQCPGLFGQKDAVRCAWPSRLELSVGEKEGRFTQGWHVDSARWVPLPGDEKRWPLDVTVDGKRGVVVAQSAVPSVRLEPGDHVVAGTFAWDSPPESLKVPLETGLLSLVLRGVRVGAPVRDASGSVFLQKTTTQEEGEKLEIVAHRKVTDDIPLLLSTHLELDVAGKSREVVLGKALPPGFVPMSLDTQLPARLEPDSRLRVQVRPGRWSVDLVARSEGAIAELARPAPDGPWRTGEEVWAFEARPELRLVDVGGPSTIDPAQTSLPDAWKRLPAYPMKAGDKLTFTERRRGDAEPPPNQLTLSRNLWLDFEGRGYTISDTLTGTLSRDSRLEMDPPTRLGRVAMGGRDQFITHLGDAARTGVEVRQGELSVSADSRLDGDPHDIPAVGWRHDFRAVSGTLHLPPGWRLFHASGVDEVPGTWIREWSLLSLFLALVTAVAVGRLFGWRWGVVSLAMLALTLPESGAPRFAWLAVLVAEALSRVLPEGLARRIAKVMRGGMIAIAAIIVLPFVVDQARAGMYPVLANEDVRVGDAEQAYASMGGEQEGGGGFFRQKEANAPAAAEPVPQTVAPAPPMLKSPSKYDDAKDKRVTKAEDEGEDGDVLMPTAPAASATGQGLDLPPSRSGWGGRLGGSGKKAPQAAQFNLETYDPNAVVQTGPGLPKWQWSSIPLRWSGPVAMGQRLVLWLVPPWANLALAFLRIFLVGLVLLRLLPQAARFFPKGWGPPAPPAAAVAALLALAFAFAPGAARADMPDKGTLDELRARLTTKPDCTPQCASSSRLAFEVTPQIIRGRMEIDAAAATAVPLPGNASQWLPDTVLLDGAPAKALLRTAEGVLWIALPAGTHQLVFEGAAPERDSVQLALPLKPHRVEVRAEGWVVAGVHEDGLADDNVQFTRIARDTAAGGSLQQGTLPPFVRVERTVSAALNWQVDTRVVRLTPPGSAVVVEVPLLPGESVTTADVRVDKGKALVNMGPTATEVTWHSVLEQKSPLAMRAPKQVGWTEIWRIDVGPMWHAQFAGIPPVHAQIGSGANLPEWRPWPGEEASIELSRPDGVAGQSLTIDGAYLDVSPGLRATDATLTLSMRASRGATHVVTLPEGAQLESLLVNGASQPIRQEGRKVTLAIVPGAQGVIMGWRQPTAIGAFFRTPEVDLGAPSVNTTIMVKPGSRWVLFLGGPAVGPAVLFWSLLLVLLCASALLGKIRWTPLRAWHWALLAVGLSQVPIVTAALVAGWLVFLGWRGAKPELGRGWFNVRQIAVVGATLVALIVLAVAIQHGLLGQPDMQVRGNGSSASALRWFVDRSDSTLRTAWVVSVPMLVYRGAMLAWALWVALAIVGWLRWGWGAFGQGGLWMKPPPPPPPAQPQPYRAPEGAPMQGGMQGAPMQGPPMAGMPGGPPQGGAPPGG